jgi:hypothetical protein
VCLMLGHFGQGFADFQYDKLCQLLGVGLVI